jgi:hypothetical protein
MCTLKGEHLKISFEMCTFSGKKIFSEKIKKRKHLPGINPGGLQRESNKKWMALVRNYL